MFPLSALIADPGLFAGVPARGTAFQSTFNNSPLGVTIAYETLRIAERHDYFSNARAQGDKLLADLEFIEGCPPFSGLRGTGLAIAWDVVDANGTPNRELARRFVHCALDEHVITYACGVAGNVIKIAPMLGIDDADRATIVDALKRCSARFAETLT